MGVWYIHKCGSNSTAYTVGYIYSYMCVGNIVNMYITRLYIHGNLFYLGGHGDLRPECGLVDGQSGSILW